VKNASVSVMTGQAALAIGRWSGNHNINRGAERKYFLR
jgi:hypothetical protein